MLGLVPTEGRSAPFVQSLGAFRWPEASNYPTSWRSATPSLAAALPNLIDVEKEFNSTFFLTEQGLIFGSGYGANESSPLALPHSVPAVVDIEAGFDELFGLTASGDVWLLGKPFDSGPIPTPLSPVKVTLPPIKEIKVEGAQFFAVARNGELYERNQFNSPENYSLIHTSIKSIAPDINNAVAVLTLDGSVFEMDLGYQFIPPAPIGPLAVQGLPTTITSLSYAVGVFAALDVSGDVYVWPKAAYPAASVAPRAVKLNGISNVAELQLHQGPSSQLVNGDQVTEVYLAARLESRRLITGIMTGVVPGPSGTSRLIVPNDLNLVEHDGLWDGFDYENQLVAFSTNARPPLGDACWQNYPTTDPRVKICGVSITNVSNGWDLEQLKLSMTFAKDGGVEFGIAGNIAKFVNGQRVDFDPNQVGVLVSVEENEFPGTLSPATLQFYQPLLQTFGVLKIKGWKFSQSVIQREGKIRFRVVLDANKNGVADAGETYVDRTGRIRLPVAFGDSYSSGEGARDFDRSSTTDTNNCHRSRNAYARITRVADPSLGPADALLSRTKLYACSGGRTYTMNSTIVDSDLLRTIELAPMLKNNNKSILPLSQNESFGPSPDTIDEKRQILTWQDDIVDVNQNISVPNYITIGIGGNDMEFAAILQEYCALIPGLNNTGCSATDPWSPMDAVDQALFPGVATFGAFVDRKLELTISRMDRTITDVKNRAIPTPIFLIGYPMLFGSAADTNWLQSPGCVVIKAAFEQAVPFFREKQVLVNEAMRALAARKGVHFVDLIPTYDVKRAGICGKGTPAINNVGLTQSVNPAVELRQMFSDPKYLSQQHFHPNITGQVINRDAIELFIRTSARLRNVDGIPINPVPNPAAIVPMVNASPQRSFLSPAQQSVAALSANAQSLSIDVPSRPCERAVDVPFSVNVFGGTATPAVLNLTDPATGAVLGARTVSFSGSTQISIPASLASSGIQLLDPVSGTRSRTFDVPNPSVPCSRDDYTAGAAGQNTVLSLLNNDGPTATSIQNFASTSPWITQTSGSTVTAAPPLGTSGSYTFTYNSCTAAGGCTRTEGNFDVEPPVCTLNPVPGTTVMTGTDGVDVMCVDSSIDQVDAKGGDDIILVNSPVMFINSGPGTDTIISDGIVILSSPDADQIESDSPILRITTGVNPVLPNVAEPPRPDTTPPVITINAPAMVDLNSSVSAQIVCTDDSGTAACPSNIVLDTTVVGVFTKRVTATDSSGNAASALFVYEVIDQTPATTTTTTTTTTTLPATTTTTTTTTTTPPVLRRPVVVGFNSTGKSLSVTGAGTHINGLSISGANASVSGAGNKLGGLHYAGTLTVTGAGNTINPAAQKLPLSFVPTINLAAYQPGGSVATSGVTYTAISPTACVSGVWRTTASALPSGTVYVPCSVVITGTSATKQTTIAVNGSVNIQAAGLRLTSPPGSPSIIASGAVSLTGAGLVVGSEVRSASTITVSGAGGSYGCLAGQTVTVTGSSNTVRGDCTILPG